MAISASEARKNLYGLIQQVNDDVEGVEIVSKHGSAVLVSADEWRSMQETAHLLRSPANARRLLKAVADIEAGLFSERELIEPSAPKAPRTAPATAKKAAPAKKAVATKRAATAKKVPAGR